VDLIRNMAPASVAPKVSIQRRWYTLWLRPLADIVADLIVIASRPITTS
jgi:hypothetical protein